MFKIKLNDQVILTTGKDKGKKGKVEKILLKENKIIVTGVNLYKRHRKMTKNRGAGIYEVQRPIDASKVSVICPKCNQPTRIGYEINQSTKTRVCKKCGGSL